MPKYIFKNKKTGESFSDLMSIKESEEFLKNNPDFEKDITQSFPAMIGGERLGIVKPDDSFKDLLKNIKKNNPGSTINT